MKEAALDEFVDQAAWLVAWVELDQWLRPEQAGIELVVDLGLDSCVAELEEAARVVAVVARRGAREAQRRSFSDFRGGQSDR